MPVFEPEAGVGLDGDGFLAEIDPLPCGGGGLVFAEAAEGAEACEQMVSRIVGEMGEQLLELGVSEKGGDFAFDAEHGASREWVGGDFVPLMRAAEYGAYLAEDDVDGGGG